MYLLFVLYQKATSPAELTLHVNYCSYFKAKYGIGIFCTRIEFCSIWFQTFNCVFRAV